MQQFIPFEDDWDALENLLLESLVPYSVHLPCVARQAGPTAHCTVPGEPSIPSSSPTAAPMRLTVPALSSNT